MAFPAVESSVSSGITSAASSTAVSYPATISASSLLVCVFAPDQTAGPGSFPGDWTKFADAGGADTGQTLSIWWKTAAGTEDGSTFTVTHNSTKTAAIVYSITGAADPSTRAPEASTAATDSTATSAAPDPASLTPTGGTKDYLWLAAAVIEGEQTNPPTYPTNYGSNQLTRTTGVAGGPGGNLLLSCATRNLNASSEDPGAYTFSGAGKWSAFTAAIHPAATPATGRPDRMMLMGVS